jgi:hypothetical protein
MGGTKHDQGKPRLELLPPDALITVAKVFGYGAQKYADWNWCEGFKWSRLHGAALRHLLAWQSGEDVDPESGLPHLAHAGCCVLMLLAHQLRKLGVDDRYVIGVPGGVRPFDPDATQPAPDEPPKCDPDAALCPEHGVLACPAPPKSARPGCKCVRDVSEPSKIRQVVDDCPHHGLLRTRWTDSALRTSRYDGCTCDPEGWANKPDERAAVHIDPACPVHGAKRRA